MEGEGGGREGEGGGREGGEGGGMYIVGKLKPILQGSTWMLLSRERTLFKVALTRPAQKSWETQTQAEPWSGTQQKRA